MNVNKEQVQQIKALRQQAAAKLIERIDIETEGNVLKNHTILKDDSLSLLKDVLKKNMKSSSRRERF
jgi:hypothetical protein